jgi:hypothetical protein
MYQDVISPPEGRKQPTKITKKTARWLYLYSTIGKSGMFKVPPSSGIKLISSYPEIDSIKKPLSEMEEQWWIVRDDHDEGNQADGWQAGYTLVQSTLSLKESREYTRKIERMIEEIEENWANMEKICKSRDPWRLLGKLLN